MHARACAVCLNVRNCSWVSCFLFVCSLLLCPLESRAIVIVYARVRFATRSLENSGSRMDIARAERRFDAGLAAHA